MLLGLTVLLLPSPAAAVGDSADDPAAWPTGAATDPDLSASAHSLRFSGPDRFQTNLAATLALRGQGDFPFDTPDRTASGDWWGAATCPFSVLVVAGDTFADALAAASLSDPTNRSTQPRLQRVAAADPLFDPVGGFDRVDTDGAPIIVTASARSGATALAPSARLAVADLATGGCRNAREAIIVGGEAAVHRSVASQLINLGYDEVFRVSGADRYETAAEVAGSLGTGSGTSSTACVDPRVDDGDARMGFYGNAVAEFRFTPDSCRLLTRSVVLADGSTGADALAAGWWTSFWQVPILLTAPDGSLPAATRTALQTLAIDNVIVLGGTGRIPEATVDEAGRLAGAAVGRIAGPDRYATSAEMARLFGGWHPGTVSPASMICLAASSGSMEAATGWPDTLAAGPWCGRAAGAAANPGAPVRALAPTHGAHALSHAVGDRRPTRDAVPVLLTPVAATSLPSSVSGLLAGAFEPSAPWCSSLVEPRSCLEPGFAVVFGGAGVIPEAAVLHAARLVSGDRYTSATDVLPSIGEPFLTDLDMAPVFGSGGTDALRQVCTPRGGVSGVRWLSVSDDDERIALDTTDDLIARRIYVDDADGVARSPVVSAPACVRFGGADSGRSVVAGVSPSGRVTPRHELAYGSDAWVALSRAVEQAAPVESGVPGSDTQPGGETTWRFSGPPAQAVVATIPSDTRPVETTTATITLRRGAGSRHLSIDTFVATLDLHLSMGRIAAVASGEARLVDGIWELRGHTTHSGGVTPAGGGGFRASIDPAAPGDAGGDAVAWRLDGTVG